MEKKKKILWIDDDVNNPELLCDRAALEERECVITPVTTPDELKMDSIPQFDCIIMDLFLPVGEKMSLTETQYGARTGFVLLKQIKKLYPQAKSVVYSVFNIQEVNEYCNKNEIPHLNKSNYSDSDLFAEDIIKLINGDKL